MKQLFVGIDPSLTSTGLFLLTKKDNEQYQYDYAQIDTKPKDFNSSIERCLYIADIIVSLIKQHTNDSTLRLVVCQDYFVGRQQGAVIQLAELGTLIRYKILKEEYPLTIASPKTIKKFVTGTGNAKKQLMMQTVFEKWNYKASTDNLADACGMSRFAQFLCDLWDKNVMINEKKDLDFLAKYLTKDCIIKIK